MAQEGPKTIDKERSDYAIGRLTKIGLNPTIVSNESQFIEINFTYKESVIKLFPYTGWFQGKGLIADRGIHKLLKQLKNNKL
jgi:hypothetical protein